MKPPERLRQANDDIAYVLAHWPKFLEALRDRAPDWLHGGGTDTPGRGGPANPTATVVQARQHWAEKHSDAEALTIQIQADVRALVKIITSVGGQQIMADLCNGIGLPGFHEWGDPTCRDAAVRGPVCYRCYMRSYRWMRGQTA